MSSPAALLLSTINSLSLGVSARAAKEADTGNAITVYDTGGLEPISGIALDSQVARRPSVQVRVRHKSYATAYSWIEQIAAKLVSHSDSVFSSIRQQGDIIPIGQSNNNESILTVNFNLIMRGD